MDNTVFYSHTLLVAQLSCHPSKYEGEEEKRRETWPNFYRLPSWTHLLEHSRISVSIITKKLKLVQHLCHTETVHETKAVGEEGES